MEKTTEVLQQTPQELLINALKEGKKIKRISFEYLTSPRQKPRFLLLGKWAGLIEKAGEKVSVVFEDDFNVSYNDQGELIKIRFEDKKKFNKVTEDYDQMTVIPLKIFTIPGLRPYQLSFPIGNMRWIEISVGV